MLFAPLVSFADDRDETLAACRKYQAAKQSVAEQCATAGNFKNCMRILFYNKFKIPADLVETYETICLMENLQAYSDEFNKSNKVENSEFPYYSGFRIRRDPNNPKIVYYNDIQISDANGKQKVDDYMLKNIRDTAKSLNMPDPTAGITQW